MSDEKWERMNPQMKSRDKLFCTPNFNIHVSEHFLPLFPTKGFRPTDTPFISRAC